MPPTKPNKTGTSTQQDAVQTPEALARDMVAHFRPRGRVLEPCRGGGSIYRQLPEPKDWCEVREGRDFFDYHLPVDWIITNPPYSIFDRFVEHCFEVANNVVLLCPLVKTFKSIRNELMVDAYGGLREIWIVGSGIKCGFHFGFLAGCLYYQRGYEGDIKRTWREEGLNNEG